MRSADGGEKSQKKETIEMSKVAVVFWSGTGNTQAMAEAVAEGARTKGAEVTLFAPADFDGAKVQLFDAIAFGCPAYGAQMGAEVLEELEFQPMFDRVKGALDGKKVALFGSWGWGNGAWMNDWVAACKEAGVLMQHEPVICKEEPDEAALKACRELGASLL